MVQQPERHRWLRMPMLSTAPELVGAVDQVELLDALREWALHYTGKRLTNDQVAELALVQRNVVEAWRAPPHSSSHRTMPLHRRLLLIYRLRDQAKTHTAPWTEEESQFLRDNYGHRSHAELAAEIGRTPAAVGMQISVLGLNHNKRRPFSEQEIEYIREHYATQTKTEIAKTLGRHPVVVMNKARELGLSIKRPRAPRRNARTT